MVLALSDEMSVADIAGHLDVGEDSIWRILQYYVIEAHAQVGELLGQRMDKERRGELAKIIGRIKETYGFEQLFVISHDESFETMTEQVIRLVKEDGATKLEREL